MKTSVFALVLLLSMNAQAFLEIFAVSDLRARLTNPDQYNCRNSEERFWKVEKVVSKRHSQLPEGEDNEYLLRYSQFGCELGGKGAIVMVPGRTEGSVDYYEMAEEYYGMGYSPIFVMDPRGQGFSPRLLDNPHKGHVDLFDDYAHDLDAMMKKAVLPQLESIGWQKGETPLFLTSNSMGGGIAIGYFQLIGDENPFTAGAFMGSMLLTNYAGFLPLEQTPELYQQFSETNVRLLLQNRCLVQTEGEDERKACFADYPQEIPNGDYMPGRRQFVADKESIMTNSPYRYAIREMLWEELDWSEFKAENYAPGENWHGLEVGGATQGWVLQSTLYNPQLRSAENLAKMSANVPFILVSGTRDLRIYRVFAGTDDSGQPVTMKDLKPHADFCDTVNSVFGNENQCQLVPIVGGFHELYKETDANEDFRGQTFDAAHRFFQQFLN